jgi:hypothetical protein
MSEPKVFKVRVELPNGEPALLPKVSAASLEDLSSKLEKELEEYVEVFSHNIIAMDMLYSFGC